LLSDPRFADDAQRGQNGAEISALMAAWCATRSRDDVLAALAGAKIPAAAVYSPQQALEDPHIRAAGLLQERPISGSTQHAPLAPHPVAMSADPAVFDRPAPGLGEHTQEILASLGYDAAAVAELKAQGVI
jgi:crotonobetainyl-CoA:carnitine CoA-transferase CaiB-like acyl-CoA transferase